MNGVLHYAMMRLLLKLVNIYLAAPNVPPSAHASAPLTLPNGHREPTAAPATTQRVMPFA